MFYKMLRVISHKALLATYPNLFSCQRFHRSLLFGFLGVFLEVASPGPQGLSWDLPHSNSRSRGDSGGNAWWANCLSEVALIPAGRLEANLGSCGRRSRLTLADAQSSEELGREVGKLCG